MICCVGRYLDLILPKMAIPKIFEKFSSVVPLSLCNHSFDKLMKHVIPYGHSIQCLTIRNEPV